jgi:hypothetical protein
MKYRILLMLVTSMILSLLVLTNIQTTTMAQKKFSLSKPNNSDLIGYIRKEHVADGCGCTYFFKGNATRPVYSDDFGGNIWVNINGEDVKLKLIGSVSVPKGEARRGQRTTSRYIAPGIKVKMDIVIGKDYGEGRDHAGTITVIKGDRQQTVQIVGFCGC